jgi:chromate transporter
MTADGNETKGKEEAASATSLVELAGFFLRLGATAFGGPAAHIAMMEEEIVRRRGWLTREQFLDRLGASNLIPGPSSTELAIHIGYRQAGWRGLIVAGTCFILPAFLLVMAIAGAYAKFGQRPQMAGILYGVKPIVIAVIAQALWNLGRTAVKTRFLAAVGLIATALTFLNIGPLWVLFGAGAVTSGSKLASERSKGDVKPLLGLVLLVSTLIAVPTFISRLGGTAATFGLKPLFWVFLKLGSVVYGSGYVLLAFLRTELVTHRGWISSGQLLDSVAVGQVTPGPVFTTATFIGYLLAGPKGATVATLGIFLPAFLLVGLTGPLIAGLRKSAVAGAFLDGVNVASLALMLFVSWQLGRAALIDPPTILLALVSFALLLRYRVNSAWLVLAGALLGAATYRFRGI